MEYKHLIIQFSILVIFAAEAKGSTKYVDIEDPVVTEVKDFVVKKFNEGKGIGEKSFIKVLRANLLVYDTLTQLTLKVNETGIEKLCKVNVFHKPWLKQLEILDVKCSDGLTLLNYHNLNGKRRNVNIVLFNNFLKKYNKTYSDKNEYNKRYRIFKANLKKIEILNENEQGTGKYGINQFADLSSTEFKWYLGYKRPDKFEVLPLAEIPKISLPESFDWRHYNVVTPVKNQGACGSCWAFSVTGNVEGQWALKSGNLLSLSEQELVDCDTLDNGCLGGYMTNAYKSIKSIGGFETESEYPYEGENYKCHFDIKQVVVKIQGGVNITNDEKGMAQWLVRNGPMSVALNANAMQFYIGGISHPPKFLCNPSSIDHAVLIVGFGTRHSRILKRSIPYWIVKNSWGHHWGEAGYYKIFRGGGTCGINQMASSAVV